MADISGCHQEGIKKIVFTQKKLEHKIIRPTTVGTRRYHLRTTWNS